MTECGSVRKVDLNKLESLIAPLKRLNLAKMHLEEIYNSLPTAMQQSQSTRMTRISPIWFDKTLYIMLTKVKELYRSEEWEPYKSLRKIYKKTYEYKKRQHEMDRENVIILAAENLRFGLP